MRKRQLYCEKLAILREKDGFCLLKSILLLVFGDFWYKKLQGIVINVGFYILWTKKLESIPSAIPKSENISQSIPTFTRKQ